MTFFLAYANILSMRVTKTTELLKHTKKASVLLAHTKRNPNMLPILFDICQPPAFNNCVVFTEVVAQSDKPKDKESGNDVPNRGGSRREMHKAENTEDKQVHVHRGSGRTGETFRIENSNFSFYYKQA